MKQPRLIVVKIGSNVLTEPSGKPDLDRMISLVNQLTYLMSQNKKVVLVTSGAVAFGRQELRLPDKLDPVLKKQIWASSGQIELIKAYKQLFEGNGIKIAQILVTKEDFRDRKHFLNMKNCITGLLSQGIVPVINENDTVAITELMFTDNDELASLTAAMVNADTMVLLTNVDGIYDGPPSESGSRLIIHIGSEMPNLENVVSPVKSSFGRGGMLTKMTMAKKSADLGIQVLIANGKREKILQQIFTNEAPYTYFEPKSAKHGSKKWLAHGDQYFKGEVTVNKGAKEALFSTKISSLLPIGISSFSGNFQKGDIIRIIDETGNRLGLGRAEYSSLQLSEKIGQKNQKPIVHYDYLYLFDHV